MKTLWTFIAVTRPTPECECTAHRFQLPHWSRGIRTWGFILKTRNIEKNKQTVVLAEVLKCKQKETNRSNSWSEISVAKLLVFFLVARYPENKKHCIVVWQFEEKPVSSSSEPFLLDSQWRKICSVLYRSVLQQEQLRYKKCNSEEGKLPPVIYFKKPIKKSYLWPFVVRKFSRREENSTVNPKPASGSRVRTNGFFSPGY